MSTLSDQLAATKAAGATALPPEVAATFTAQQESLATVPVPVVAAGTEMPSVALLTAKGETTTTDALLDGRTTVVVFYRGGWCPYCNVTLRTYEQDLVPELRARGVGLVAVSPQRPDGSLSTLEAAGLTFEVVSDPSNALAGALGIVDNGSEEVRAAQRALGLDLDQVNAEGDHRLPMPAVVIVGADRRVRWADVHPDYTSRTAVEDILAAL